MSTRAEIPRIRWWCATCEDLHDADVRYPCAKTARLPDKPAKSADKLAKHDLQADIGLRKKKARPIATVLELLDQPCFLGVAD